MDKNQNNKKSSMAIWIGATVFLLVWSSIFLRDIHEYVTKKIAAEYFRDVGDFRNGRAQVTSGEWGSLYIDKEGHVLPSPPAPDNFAKIQPDEGFAKKEESKSKKGIINKATGEWVAIFYNVLEFREGLAIARAPRVGSEGEGMGIIDQTGKWVVQPGLYSDIQPLGNAYSLQSKNTQSNRGKERYLYGYLVLKDHTIIQPAFSTIHDFNESGTAFAMTDGKWGLINSKGNWVVEPQFERVAEEFHEGLAYVQKGSWRGYIDTAGQVEIVLQPGWRSGCNFSEGLAAVQNENGAWLYIDKQGRAINLFQHYEDARDFYEGLAAVSKNGKWGFINKAGQEVVLPQYVEVKKFHEGLAAAKTNQWGYIDKTGRIVIPFQYFEANDFHEGLTGVRTLSKPGTGWVYINSSGALVIKNVK